MTNTNDKHIIDNLHKFGTDFQIKCISSLLSDKTFLERLCDILDLDYWETDAHKWIVKTISEYFLTYKEIPTLTTFKINVDAIENEVLKKSVIEQLKIVYQKISASDIKFVKEQFLEFCKNQKLKNAIISSVDDLKTGNYDKIKNRVDAALKAGMERNIGHEYNTDVDTRMSTTARHCVKTNWRVIDEIMDGGLGKGELGVVTAPAGIGKSWLLAHIGSEAMKQGKNIVHYTLELNENYVGIRYDACFTGIDFQNIKNNVDIVKERLKTIPGKLFIKYFPIKTISAQTIKIHTERIMMLGTKIDMVIVDYADILRPIESARNSNSYQEAGGIYEELRGVAGELQIPIWTASQSNRSSLDEDIIQAINIADSYRKIMTADFVMSVSRKIEDKISNTARVHIIKNRFGPDGMTYPTRMNTGCGDIQLFDEKTQEGISIIGEMSEGENVVKKLLSNKWKAHSDERE
jgi:replicative DNA helicase